MKLKLADYGKKKEKFESFLEIGKDFMYGESFIFIHNTMLQCHLGRVGKDGNVYHDFKKDEKDPLNRFDGLFDGRTYGEGRFVLIMGFETAITELDARTQTFTKTKTFTIWQDFIAHRPENEEENLGELNYLVRFDEFTENCGCCSTVYGFEQTADREYFYPNGEFEIKNIHENPELWEKVR